MQVHRQALALEEVCAGNEALQSANRQLQVQGWKMVTLAQRICAYGKKAQVCAGRVDCPTFSVAAACMHVSPVVARRKGCAVTTQVSVEAQANEAATRLAVMQVRSNQHGGAVGFLPGTHVRAGMYQSNACVPVCSPCSTPQAGISLVRFRVCLLFSFAIQPFPHGKDRVRE